MFPKKLFHPIVVWKQSFSSSKTSSIIDNGFGLVGTNPLLSWQENVIAYLKEALVLFSIPSDGPFVCAYVWLASITTTRTICIPSCIGEIWGIICTHPPKIGIFLSRFAWTQVIQEGSFPTSFFRWGFTDMEFLSSLFQKIFLARLQRQYFRQVFSD